MKPTQIAELFANIRTTIVSFFSILMFVALGVSVFLGISWAGPALENATGQVFDKGSFHNFQVQFPYGLTDSDVKALSEIEGVSQVETAYQSFQTVRLDGNKLTVKVQSLGQSIDTPIVAEGELPTKAGEMAFHAESARRLGDRRGVRASGSYQEGTGKSGSYGMWNHPRGHVWNVFVRPASS